MAAQSDMRKLATVRKPSAMLTSSMLGRMPFQKPELEIIDEKGKNIQLDEVMTRNDCPGPNQVKFRLLDDKLEKQIQLVM